MDGKVDINGGTCINDAIKKFLKIVSMFAVVWEWVYIQEWTRVLTYILHSAKF